MSRFDGPRPGRPPFRAARGMVATSHYLASATGLSTLRRGGSAVDAAIAANAVLAVTYPHMAGLGGDGFWLIYEPGEAQVRALNASGPAATAATRDYYAERGHRESIPARGELAALTVPGAMDGWRQAHAQYGHLSWADLFDDAIVFARGGFAISRSLADWLAQDAPILRQFDTSARTFLREGAAPREGERLRQPELATSLELIATLGAREAFYEGELAERICRAVEAGGAPLRVDDLAGFQAEWVEPISTTYRGYQAWNFPPNTQGFAALQLLNLLEGFDVASIGDNTTDYYHVMAEAVKVAFADRDAWLTDPKFVDIPLDKLLSKSYADERRGLISLDRAQQFEAVEPGIAYGRQHARQVADGDTCYFCVADGDGMVVSLIQSIYHDFGSGVVAGDTGIILQNRGAFFSLDPEHPNTLEPGKRTFHTLIPAMLFQDDHPYLLYGTMGGEGQPQTQAAIATRLIDFGYDVQQAIEAPRWLMGRTWGVASRDLSLEGRIADEVARELKRRGQPVRMVADWDDNMGHAQAIRINEDGTLEGGADPRGDGIAIGY
jgi:oxamate amidohydrolase